MKAQLTLAIFDDKLMNGLDFCEKVYDLVENITNSPNGIEALQLRNSPELKKLAEKLIPLSKYIQGRYGPNRRLKVRWIDGRDGYDAQVLSSGAFLDKRTSPRRHWIEITNVVQESNPHLPLPPSKRPLMFEVKGISVDRTTQKITSRPYRYGTAEAEADLAKKILEQIQTRGALKHPRHTVLVIERFLSNLLFHGEWERAIALVREWQKRPRFSEIFVCDSVQGYSATIYRRPRRFKPTLL